MTTVALPSAFRPESCKMTLATNQRVSADNFNTSEQPVDLLGDRWLMSVDLPQHERNDGPWREAFINSFRGQFNTVNLYHFEKPRPRGTVRGTLTLSASVAQGAASIAVAGCVPSTGTLLAGDMLGVGGLLVEVTSDCTAVAGVITVPINNRIRKALSSGAAVTWDKPTAAFRLLANTGVSYSQGVTSATTFDFGEAIS